MASLPATALGPQSLLITAQLHARGGPGPLSPVHTARPTGLCPGLPRRGPGPLSPRTT